MLQSQRDTSFDKLRNEREAIDKLAKNLELLRSDAELRRHGYRIHFAIDFSEVFAYGYPLAELYYSQDVGESPEDALNKQTVALLFLFSGSHGQLLLLPPYVIELRDHLALMREKAINFQRHIDVCNLVDSHLFNARVRPKEIDELVIKHQRNETFSEAECSLIVDYAKRYYSQLWVTLTCGVARGSQRITELATDGRIGTLAQVLPKLRIDPSEIWASAQPWIQEIEAIPVRLGRTYANCLDGAAVAYLATINRMINDHKEILVFISRSKAMKQLLTGNVLATPRGWKEPVEIARDIDYLITYMIYRRAIHDGDEEYLETSLKLANDFLKCAKQLEEMRDRDSSRKPGEASELLLSMEDMWSRALGFVDQLRDRRNSYNNLKLSSQVDKQWKQYIDRAEKWRERRRITKNTEVAVKVINLIIGNRQLQDSIQAEASDIDKQMRSTSAELAALLEFGGQHVSALIRALHEHARASDKLELPYKMRFMGDRAEELENMMAEWLTRGDEALEEARKYVSEYARDRDGDIDRYLLWAYIQIIARNWGFALDMIEKGIEACRTHGISPHELLFWKAVGLWNQGPQYLEQAIEACEQAIGAKEEIEPRYYTKMGLLLWRQLVERVARERRAYTHGDAKHILDRAIVFLEQALSVPADDRLQMHIRSSLALLYAERSGAEDLQKAEQQLGHLEKLRNREDWPPSVRAVEGIVMLARARKRRTGWEAIQVKARALIETAIRTQTLGAWEQKFLRRRVRESAEPA